MHEYTATISWTCEGEFSKGRYSRAHDWAFDGGVTLRASASPLSVPVPYSDASAVDPEEAFVAAISSCHMLTFLDIIRRVGFGVSAYTDDAIGQMTEADGRWWVSRVNLHPEIAWDGAAPDADQLAQAHHEAHERCFIANSVRSEVVVHAQGGLPIPPN